MNSNRQIKVDIISEIKEKINNSKSLVIANYSGLKVKEITQLKNELRKSEVELKVYKNRLFKLAIKESDFSNLDSILIGQNIFAFGTSDDIAPARIIAKFAKEYPTLEIIAGTFEGKVLDQEGMNEVALLPTFEEALTKLATGLITPIKNISIGLNMLEEKHLFKEKTNIKGEE